MGLDVESRDLSEAAETAPEGDGLLRDFAEAAIQTALRTGRDHFSFHLPAEAKSNRQELSDLCGELKKKYPALKAIEPHLIVDGAVAYLNNKPGPVMTFLHRISGTDV